MNPNRLTIIMELAVQIVLLGNGTVFCQAPLLTGISSNYGLLQPSFSPYRGSYTLTLPLIPNLPPVTVTPVEAKPGLIVRVDGIQVLTGQPSFPFDTSVARHVITVTDLGLSRTARYAVFLRFVRPALVRDSSLELTDIEEPYIMPPDGPNVPRFMDSAGALYSETENNVVIKSSDFGATWDTLFTVPDSLGTVFDKPALVVSSMGRVILATTDGYVLVSNSQQDTFHVAFKFLSKYPTLHLAHSVYDSLIFLGGYWPITGDTLGWNEVYASRDGGNTWSRIFADSSRDHRYVFHDHDVKFDPYSNMIWVVTGDVLNNQIYYSYNWGRTWHTVFQDYQTSKQCSQAIPFPIGTVFASDQAKNTIHDGLHFWLRPHMGPNPEVSSDNFTTSEAFVSIDTSLGLAHFGIEGSSLQRYGDNFYILPWFSDPYSYQDSTRLWGTFDGLTWYQLYASPPPTPGAGGFYDLVGPYQADSLNRIWAAWNGDSGSSLFTARIKFPGTIEAPQVIPDSIQSILKYRDPTLSWHAARFALTYSLQVASDSTYSSVILRDSLITGTNYYCAALPEKSTYYWRVKAIGFGHSSPWSLDGAVTTGSALSGVVSPKVQTSQGTFLLQNFPNPANPSTTIMYSLKLPTHVRIDVFNSLGQLVTTLVDRDQSAGMHQVFFGPGGLASGVYFYRLLSGRTVLTGKIAVIK